MTALVLEGEGVDWRLHLNGDWSFAAMAPIEAQPKYRFINEKEITVLSAAGPGLSGWPPGHAFAVAVVREVLGH